MLQYEAPLPSIRTVGSVSPPLIWYMPKYHSNPDDICHWIKRRQWSKQPKKQSHHPLYSINQWISLQCKNDTLPTFHAWKDNLIELFDKWTPHWYKSIHGRDLSRFWIKKVDFYVKNSKFTGLRSAHDTWRVKPLRISCPMHTRGAANRKPQSNFFCLNN